MSTNDKMYWGGDDVCDICECKIHEPLYDAKTITGQWAVLCSSCFDHYTFGRLGTGSGQKYIRTVDNRLIKVEG